MDEGVQVSDKVITKDVYILLILNVVGVVAAMAFVVFLVLWALGFILQEPDTSPVISNYIFDQNKMLNESSVANRAEFLDELLSNFFLN